MDEASNEDIEFQPAFTPTQNSAGVFDRSENSISTWIQLFIGKSVTESFFHKVIEGAQMHIHVEAGLAASPNAQS